MILFRLFGDYPLVLAGNRDEFLDRPSMDPHRWQFGEAQTRTAIFAGKDLECGGTWMGVNPDGLVAGVTNVSTGTRDPDKLSRGQLVLRCLAAPSVRAVRDELLRGGSSQYNPFNLFCLSRDSGFLLTTGSSAPVLEDLEPGVHILTNRPLGDPDDPRREWIRSQLLPGQQEPAQLEPLLPALLSHHGNEGENPPVCMHLPGYGTRSSHLLFLGSDISRSRFLYCKGPPCRNPFHDLSPELRILFQRTPVPAD